MLNTQQKRSEANLIKSWALRRSALSLEWGPYEASSGIHPGRAGKKNEVGKDPEPIDTPLDNPYNKKRRKSSLGILNGISITYHIERRGRIVCPIGQAN
jgi:hypothetical protein